MQCPHGWKGLLLRPALGPGTHLGVGPVGLDLDQGVAAGQQLGHLAGQPQLPPGIALHGAGQREHCGGTAGVGEAETTLLIPSTLPGIEGDRGLWMGAVYTGGPRAGALPAPWSRPHVCPRPRSPRISAMAGAGRESRRRLRG